MWYIIIALFIYVYLKTHPTARHYTVPPIVVAFLWLPALLLFIGSGLFYFIKSRIAPEFTPDMYEGWGETFGFLDSELKALLTQPVSSLSIAEIKDYYSIVKSFELTTEDDHQFRKCLIRRKAKLEREYRKRQGGAATLI